MTEQPLASEHLCVVAPWQPGISPPCSKVSLRLDGGQEVRVERQKLAACALLYIRKSSRKDFIFQVKRVLPPRKTSEEERLLSFRLQPTLKGLHKKKRVLMPATL